MSKPTTISVPEYTVTKPATSGTYAPVVPSSKPASSPYVPVAPSSKPVTPYPTGGNGTVPTLPTASAPAGSSKPTPTEFPGAGSKTGLSMLAVAGALAALL